MIESLSELIRYRALFWALVVRHLSSRYRGSLLGFMWSLLNPLSLMLVYTVVFHYYMRATQMEHYTVFVFCGLLPWVWLTSSLNEGTSSIVSSGHLITKSMFPAHLLPAVSVATNLINLILSLPLLFLFMWLGGVSFQWSLFLLPCVIVLQGLMLLGMAVFLSALNVLFRDVQHIVSNILTFLFFLCPIVYPATVVPEHLRFTLELNPLAVLTTMYHQVVLDGTLPTASSLLYVSSWALLLLLVGYMVFGRYRETFAELL